MLSSGDTTRLSALVEHGLVAIHEIRRQRAVYATIEVAIDRAPPRLTVLDAAEHSTSSPNAAGAPDGKAS